MARKLSRRQVLTGTAAAGVGLYLGARPLRSARAAGKITVGLEGGSAYEKYYTTRAAKFTAKTGVAVDFVAFPHDSMRQQFVQDALAGGGGMDVYIADQPFLPEFAQKGFITDLTAKVTDADRADFAGSALDSVSYQGKIYALPFIVHNTAMYYRTDLFEKAGIKGAPTTWDEYRKYAKATTSGDVFGTLIEGKQHPESTTRLHGFIQAAGGDILDANNKPTFDSDATRAALDLMTGIMFDDKTSPQGLLDLTDMQGQWLQGKLAMAPCWPYLYALSKDPAQSKVVGKFAIDSPPGNPVRAATTFSWGFMVAAGAKDPDAAWEWVKWAASTENLADFGVDQLNPVPRKSAVELVKANPSVSDEDKAAIAAFSASAGGSKSMPNVPQYSQLQDVMAVLISAVMSKSQTRDDAIKAAQEKAEEVMAG